MVIMLLGRGDGTFSAAAKTSAVNQPLSLTVGDFNGDGRADLAVPVAGNSVSMLLAGTAAAAQATAPPTVYIDSLASGTAVSGTVTISGWAIDNTSSIGPAIGGVQVLVDGIVSGTATYGIPRPDVCAAYPGRGGCPNVGFTYSLNTTPLSTGSHTVTAVATAADFTLDTASYSISVIAGAGVSFHARRFHPTPSMARPAGHH